MGPEKLDNGVYYMRGLYDLADMARAEHDGATAAWATHLADRLRARFEQTWWDPSVSQYADSLADPGNKQVYLKNWIDQVPMEAELTTGTQVTPGAHAVVTLCAVHRHHFNTRNTVSTMWSRMRIRSFVASYAP